MGKDAVAWSKYAHQDDCDKDDGDVTVENSRECVLEAGLDGRIDALAGADFLTDTLCRDDVGIHTEAQT